MKNRDSPILKIAQTWLISNTTELQTESYSDISSKMIVIYVMTKITSGQNQICIQVLFESQWSF